MSGYIRHKVVSLDFEGKSVTVSLAAIELQDTLKFKNVDISKKEEALEILFALVRKYATIVVAPLAADGTPVTLEEICTKTYFTELTARIGNEVILTGRVPDPLASGASLPSG